jgi:hypothetical protein
MYMFSFLRLPFAICVAVFSLNAHAYSSVAGSGDDAATIAYSANIENAADADLQAIRNCQKTVNAKLQGAASCTVLARSTGPGFGALVCNRGATFCSYTLGAVSQADALMQARANCMQSAATGCPRAFMWKDFAGWPIQTP